MWVIANLYWVKDMASDGNLNPQENMKKNRNYKQSSLL